MVRFSDILNKITKKHGAKPSSPRPLNERELVRHDLSGHVNAPKPEPKEPVLRGDPTQEINKGIMEKLFRSVLDTPPEANAALEPMGAKALSVDWKPDVPTAPPKPRKISRPTEIRAFRNHAELLKFASLLINNIEDTLKETAG